MPSLAVIAIGGNSLIKDNAHQSLADQRSAVAETAQQIGEMISQGWNVVITHGNGPQVGLILLRAELARTVLQHTLPVDAAVADSQGDIGYMIQQALGNELRRRSIDRQVTTLITQTLVAADDPAMQQPGKPIGQFYTAQEAQKLQCEYGWIMVEDAGRGWRRVVPSPTPRAIIESDLIEKLVRTGHIVIAVGGGGIPVIVAENGDLLGIEAVIDKDLASSLLASTLHADLLLITTGVAKVALNYRQPDQHDLDRITLNEAERYLEEGHFARGSMEPKIRAVCQYLHQGGTAALITAPATMMSALHGESGTWILPENASPSPLTNITTNQASVSPISSV